MTSLLLPMVLSVLLFVVLIALKLPEKNQIGIDSALVVRDDILKEIPFGHAVSNFYYNNVLAANLFVRGDGQLNSMEETTRHRLYQNGIHLSVELEKKQWEQYKFRDVLKNQGFMLLQYFGIPLLMLWLFFGLLAIGTRFSKGGVYRFSSLLSLAVLLYIFLVPIKNHFRDQEAIIWSQHRAFMLPLLRELEYFISRDRSADGIAYMLPMDIEVIERFFKKDMFDKLNKAAVSKNDKERATSLAALEAFVYIRHEVIRNLPQHERIAPHLLPKHFFEQLNHYYATHLKKLITDNDPVVAYWALHLAINIEDVEPEALKQITDAAITCLQHEDMNVRDKAVLALGQLLHAKKQDKEKIWAALAQRQGQGQWKNSPESCDYVKAHLFNVYVDNWKTLKK